jgi:hypothetical protein
MPHCRLGRELRPGDRVLIEAVVESVQVGDLHCNVTVKTAHPMPPYESGTTIVLNTRQVDSILPTDKG